MSVVRDTFGHMHKNNFGMSCFKEAFFHMQKKQIVMSNLLNLNGHYHKEIFYMSIYVKNCGLSKLFFPICPYMFFDAAFRLFNHQINFNSRNTFSRSAGMESVSSRASSCGVY